MTIQRRAIEVVKAQAGLSFAQGLEKAREYEGRYGWKVTGTAAFLLEQAGVRFGASLIDTWNGGDGGRLSRFTSDLEGVAAVNDCHEWIHRKTSFSISEALGRQGYEVELFPL